MKHLHVFIVCIFTIFAANVANAQHFQTVWVSPFNPMNVYITSAMLNDVDLDAGDEIAIFDVFQGQEFCVGTIQLSQAITPGEYVQIICSMDDGSNPTVKNGFQIGNPFIFKYWAHSFEFEDVEFSFPYSGYDENFVALGTVLVDLSLTAEFQSQTLNLLPGWNAMSSYINPLNPVMEDLLSEISNELIIVQNPDGSYYPSGNLNDLETWNYESGYFIKLTDSVALNFIGQEIEDPEIMLEAGWNLVPVLCDTLISIVEMFGEDINKVVLIKDAVGLNLFWPEKNISTLQVIIPGKSYLINVSESFAVSFSGEPVFECGVVLIDERDGQEYNIVQIGNQCWMAENLNVGSMITEGIDQQNNGIIEKYCIGSISDSCDIYGGLYQWNEMMQYQTQNSNDGICPLGWHIPTDDEWKELEGTVDSQYEVGHSIWNETAWRGYDVGYSLKSNSGWYSHSWCTGSNSSGFDVRPSGVYGQSNSSTCCTGSLTYFWSSTEYNTDAAWRRYLECGADGVFRYWTQKSEGFSVRCVKN